MATTPINIGIGASQTAGGFSGKDDFIGTTWGTKRYMKAGTPVSLQLTDVTMASGYSWDTARMRVQLHHEGGAYVTGKTIEKKWGVTPGFVKFATVPTTGYYVLRTGFVLLDHRDTGGHMRVADLKSGGYIANKPGMFHSDCWLTWKANLKYTYAR